MSSIIEKRWLISEIRIRVVIEYVSRKINTLFIFQSNLPIFLINQCNKKAKKIRQLVDNSKE